MPQDRPKVLFIGLDFAHKFYLSRHKKLFSRSFDVHSITVDKDPIIKRVFRRRSFITLPIELGLIAAIMLRYKPQYVISIGPKVGLLSSVVSIFFPNCVSTHWFTGQFWANSENKSREKSFWIDWLICKFSNNTLCDGPTQRAFLHRELSPAKKTLSVLPGSINGVDQIFFDVPPRTPNKGAFTICFVGRKAPGKGLNEIVDLACECARLFREVEFVLAGPIDESFTDYEQWRQNAQTRAQNIVFVDDLVLPHEIFYYSDAFILLSEREGFSGTVIQAQAAGRPVICSDIYGLRDTFIDKVTGFSVRSNDVSSQISAIEQLMCSSVYVRMSIAAKEFAFQFGEEEFIKQLEIAYSHAGFKF